MFKLPDENFLYVFKGAPLRGPPGGRPPRGAGRAASSVRSRRAAPRARPASSRERHEGRTTSTTRATSPGPCFSTPGQVTQVPALRAGGVGRARSGGLAAPSPPRTGALIRANLSVTTTRRSRG
ncbi:hypothetical protein GCM10022416_25780 [Actinomadura keratinilytica]|uniref:Uncharacterized protein n=1 Tax=Actinomadura keratinilytica TaxID=547461 RepID=A0ABP7YPU5_9ACTN